MPNKNQNNQDAWRASHPGNAYDPSAASPRTPTGPVPTIDANTDTLSLALWQAALRNYEETGSPFSNVQAFDPNAGQTLYTAAEHLAAQAVGPVQEPLIPDPYGWKGLKTRAQWDKDWAAQAKAQPHVIPNEEVFWRAQPGHEHDTNEQYNDPTSWAKGAQLGQQGQIDVAEYYQKKFYDYLLSLIQTKSLEYEQHLKAADRVHIVVQTLDKFANDVREGK